jgi:hypothetical protein
MATMFSAWVVLVYLVGGRGAFDEMGTTVYAVLLCYYIAGIIGGALVGLLLPLTRTLVGRMLVGGIASLVVCVSAQTTLQGAAWHWDRTTLVVTTVIAVVVGMILGPLIARELRS